MFTMNRTAFPLCLTINEAPRNTEIVQFEAKKLTDLDVLMDLACSCGT